MKTFERYFPVVRFKFIVVRQVVLTFESGDEILKCDNSDEGF